MFNAIGTAFGVGDGSTTFILPDLRGEFEVGLMIVAYLVSVQADEFKKHTHTVSVYGYEGNMRAVANDPQTLTGGSYSILAAGGTKTRPRNVALLACINY